MIPEFPLPPSEADFYHSKLYTLPPQFNVFRFEMPQLSVSDTQFSATPTNPIDLMRPLKLAAIRARNYRNPSNLTIQQQNVQSRISAVSHSLRSIVSSQLAMT